MRALAFRLGALASLVLTAPVALLAAPPDSPRPNIVLIMSDDMGYSDLGSYGGVEHRTPNLDGLAAGGVRFTQFYNTARCCPTRASLLTGLYPHQAGIGHMMEDRGFDGYRGILNRHSVTIAEALKPAGYRTYMVGKWHVTRLIGPDGDKSTWPLGRGFEKFYGTLAGAGSYFDPTNLCRQDQLITPLNDPVYHPESFYYTDALADNAVMFLKEHQQESAEKPFFLYVAFTAAHWPMHAPDDAVKPYAGQFDQGYGPLRTARLAQMKMLGLLPPGAEMSAQADDWNAVDDKAREARCKEVYAAMIERMDTGIGRIVAQLKASGQLDNTLILFLQDNGACAEDTGRIKPTETPENVHPLGRDGLQPKVSPPMQTRDGRVVRTGPGVMPGPADTYVAYGRGWANVSNTPFREYKHWVHEGGISTPLIAHWPSGIEPARRGALERQPGHLIDLMATCVDLAGATYPTEFGGEPIKPREGVSLRPALNGQPLGRPGPIFWEHEGNRAVRDGRWKLVAKSGQPWELYDIDADRSELHDLASQDPERAKTMAAQWEAYADRANVRPVGAWRREVAGGGGGGVAPSRDRRFELKPGDDLTGASRPAIADQPLTLTATFQIDPARPDGVIVAQGGSAAGYVLFVKNGRLIFLVRDDEGTSQIDIPAPSDNRSHTAIARLANDGTLSLSLDGHPATASPAPARRIGRQPVDGLQVGRDSAGAVGPYPATGGFPFGGTVESVTLEVGP
jgi:arylsulfatase